MILKIKKIHTTPGITSKFKSPALIVLIDFRGQSFENERVHFDDLCKKIGAKNNNQIHNKTILISSITSLALKIFEQLGLPVFIRPKIEIQSESNYKIFFPTLKGCENLSKELFILLVEYVAHSYTDDYRKKKLEDIFVKIRELKNNHAPWGKNTLGMLRIAHELGIPWQRLDSNIYQFGEGSALRWFDSSLSDGASSITSYLLQNKIVTTSFLRDRKFPVPHNFLVTDENQAVLKAASLGFPVVVKPQNRDRGDGVTSLISSQEELRSAFVIAKKFSNEIIVEKHLEGRDFRLHVMNGRVYRVRERVPGGVTGDGYSDISSLISRLNADPKRGARGSNSELIKIDIDEEAYRMLDRQNLKLSDVPEKNRYVRLRSIANVSVGGLTNEFPLKLVHPDNIILAESAVKAVNIDIAAVDFITPNIEQSWKIVGGGICEINHKPQFGQDAIHYLFKDFFPSNGRIISILNIGDQCDFNFYKNLAEKLSENRIRLGFASADGAWIGETEQPAILINGAFDSFRLLLQNREVDAILVNWDASFKLFGLPTPDLVATCLVGNIPPNCSGSEIHELAQQSGELITTKTLLGTIDGGLAKLGNVVQLQETGNFLHNLAELIKSRFSVNLQLNYSTHRRN